MSTVQEYPTTFMTGLNEAYDYGTVLLEDAQSLTKGQLQTSTSLEFLKQITQEYIADMFDRRRIGRDLVSTIRINAPQMAWYEEDSVVAGVISEGSEIPLVKLSHLRYWVSVFKTGIGFGMTKEAQEDGSIDMWARTLRKCVIAMADLEDKHIMKCLSDSVPNGTDIDQATGVGGLGKDVSTHFKTAGPEDYNPLTYEALVEIYTIAQLEDVTIDTMVIHPRQVADLMKMEEFIGAHSATYQTLPQRFEAQMNRGFMGTILNMAIYVTPNGVAGEALLFDRSRFGLLLIRQPLEVHNFEYAWNQSSYAFMTQRYAPASFDRVAGFKITNLNS